MSTIVDPFFKSVNHPTSKRKRPNRQKSLIKSTKSKSKTAKVDEKDHRKNKKIDSLDEEIEADLDDHDDGDGLSADFNDDAGLDIDEDEDEDVNETPAQKRLRLAQVYLDRLQRSKQLDEGTFDAAEIDREIISSRLQQDYLETTGKLYTYLGERLKKAFESSTLKLTTFKTGKQHHRLPVTCAKLNKDGSHLYVADKQGKIVQYDCSQIWTFSSPDHSPHASPHPRVIRPIRVLQNHVPPKSSDREKFEKKQESKKVKTLSTATPESQRGHIGEVLAIDITEDEKILASGGKDKLIGVWDLTDSQSSGWKGGLRGHKDAISSISFQIGTPTLYSASYDRMIKVFNLESLTYSETLFGHQDRIHSISALRNQLVVSAGARDRTCRYWKIADESQLVFRGGGNSKLRDLLDGVGFDPNEEPEDPKLKKHKPVQSYVEGSIDCVCMVDDKLFLSGGDSGSISLWVTSKKKPIFTQALAHGIETTKVTGTENEIIDQPRWITSLYCIPYSDLFFSGSWDDTVKIWRLMKGDKGSNEIKKFEMVGEINLQTIELTGFVNSLHAILLESDQINHRLESVPNKLLVSAGLGQEPRLGRWKKNPKAKNLCLLTLVEF